MLFEQTVDTNGWARTLAGFRPSYKPLDRHYMAFLLAQMAGIATLFGNKHNGSHATDTLYQCGNDGFKSVRRGNGVDEEMAGSAPIEEAFLMMDITTTDDTIHSRS
eukprot:597121_1